MDTINDTRDTHRSVRMHGVHVGSLRVYAIFLLLFSFNGWFFFFNDNSHVEYQVNYGIGMEPEVATKPMRTDGATRSATILIP